ncbi:3-methyl-2-oxobutanoate hydroxymethyltransferase [Mobilicoccus massiliensis]|uniref:3-methyl-2-oxobutanoate hydroxymethyltransferase n=1 Tax=Mobilicoccus massiliensis TaxID=1522310 RepID=UPI00058F96C9|nr:3-methyl-2-oxobutanoate hydroxymethyltransferase [Mobilicoccus massiliensis]
MRTTLRDIARLHAEGTRFTMVTAYDYTSARIAERAGIPLLLVGDSLGMVVQGHDSTLPVAVDDIVHHSQAVVRGCETPLVVGDLPFLSYATRRDAVHAARRIMGEGGCGSVKLEGGRTVARTVRLLVESGVPVMGHLGFTPQSQHQIGVRVQGRDAAAARALVRDALALQDAGAWAIVLELVPASLAREITELLSIPTIGIGAGAHCSGEVQVWHDVLGLFDAHVPKHTRRFANLGDDAVDALRELSAQVAAGAFPGPENCSDVDPGVLAEVMREVGP